tara:strand:+ start:95 stop:328 length:234 start_codon:yes stop_codon:yes gene_type:complete
MPAATIISSRSDPEGSASIRADAWVTAGLCTDDEGNTYAEVTLTGGKDGNIIFRCEIDGVVEHEWKYPLPPPALKGG